MNEYINYGIGIAGVGKYLPEGIITNEDICKRVNTTPEDIEKKTGIKTRRKASDTLAASTMAAEAAKNAIKDAGINPEQIGLVVTCTFTGDYVYPAVSCKIQELIGAKNAGAFDVMANCTGFQVGLGVVSDRMLLDPTIEYAVVIGSALQTRFINYEDINSCLYFGDGAGAVVLKQVPKGYGILSNQVSTNGKVFDSVRMRGGGSSFPITKENVDQGLQFYELDGMEVWKQVVQYQPKAIAKSLEKAKLTLEQVDFFIFHQANLRLIEYLMGRMKMPMSKTFTNVHEYGNTADASQAIALCDAVQNKLLKKDDIVVVTGVGAGFTFGSTVIRWHE
ncbi:MAG: 3-oxoacyl-ACP synthase III family protein [Bacteriovoracaceae bacterium]